MVLVKVEVAFNQMSRLFETFQEDGVDEDASIEVCESILLGSIEALYDFA